MPTHSEREEESEIRIGRFPLAQPVQHRDEPEPTTPPDQNLDNPEPNNQTMDTPSSERRDPPYAPATTRRSRRALQPTRAEPPVTRLISRVTPQENKTLRKRQLVTARYCL